MISRLAPTDQGLGGAEPGTVALGALPSPGRPLVRVRGRGLGGGPTRAGAPPPCTAPPCSSGHGSFVRLGPAPLAAIWECRGGRNMAPSRGQCTREPRLYLPPGPGDEQFHLRPPRRALGPLKSSAELCWVRVHLLFSSHCLSTLGTLTHLTCFLLFLSGIDYWQSKSLFRITGSWNRVNTIR